MIHARFATLVGIVAAAAMMRLVPHPPNFTPIAAMALFGGAHFMSRRAAFAVPLTAMLLSDLALGLAIYGSFAFVSIPFVYGSFALIVGLGLLIRRRRSPLVVGGAVLTGSVLFFLVTNLGTWLTSGMYPKTLDGLIACYTAAIPFFRNALAGDLLYSAVLFGGFALTQRSFPILREEPTIPA